MSHSVTTANGSVNEKQMGSKEMTTNTLLVPFSFFGRREGNGWGVGVGHLIEVGPY